MNKKRAKILVVDDEPDLLDSIADVLELSTGRVVLRTTRPRKALRIMQEEDIDLLLTDYRMPGMNGLELIAAARSFVRNLGVMMITAYPDLQLAIRALNDGRVMQFFTKPPEPEALIHAITTYLADLEMSQNRREAFDRALATARLRQQA